MTILRGNADRNVHFEELISLLLKLGFKKRIKGSHHIFTKEGLNEILNLQSKSGKAKPYQVKQVRNIIVQNQLKLKDDEE